MLAAHITRWRERGHAAIPGLLASGVVAVAAASLSEHYGAPVMLLALLLGMAFHFLSQEGRCVIGIDIAAKHILRIGVGLLGAQVTLDEVAGLGAGPVLLAIFAVVLTIGFGVAAARLMRLDGRLGLLTGGAVAICGASAALAIAAVLPRDGNAQRDTIFTVIGVTTLSTAAMILYPIVAALMHLDHAATGIFLGATIHDVAQVVGAAFSLSQETGHIATFTKLLRVALLVPVVLCLSVFFRRHRSGAGRPGARLPGFLLAFTALMALNSAGFIPPEASTAIRNASRWCLAIAIAALGMKTSLRAMADVGVRSIILILAETMFLATLVLLVVVWWLR